MRSNPVRPATRRRLRLLALAALLGVACASIELPENELDERHRGAPGVRTFSVCPLDLEGGLPNELRPHTATLGEAVEDYLARHDREVEWLELHAARSLWHAARSRARREDAVGEAPAMFARALAERSDFEALVIPSIELSRARTRNSSASWDGVHRSLGYVNAPRRSAGRVQSTISQASTRGGLNGDLLVASIHVSVFLSDGTRIFQGRGGLDFLQEIDLAEIESNAIVLRARSDPFSSARALREGIAIAFQPYLPALYP